MAALEVSWPAARPELTYKEVAAGMKRVGSCLRKWTTSGVTLLSKPDTKAQTAKLAPFAPPCPMYTPAAEVAKSKKRLSASKEALAAQDEAGILVVVVCRVNPHLCVAVVDPEGGVSLVQVCDVLAAEGEGGSSARSAGFALPALRCKGFQILVAAVCVLVLGMVPPPAFAAVDSTVLVVRGSVEKAVQQAAKRKQNAAKRGAGGGAAAQDEDDEGEGDEWGGGGGGGGGGASEEEPARSPVALKTPASASPAAAAAGGSFCPASAPLSLSLSPDMLLSLQDVEEDAVGDGGPSPLKRPHLEWPSAAGLGVASTPSPLVSSLFSAPDYEAQIRGANWFVDWAVNHCWTVARFSILSCFLDQHCVAVVAGTWPPGVAALPWRFGTLWFEEQAAEAAAQRVARLVARTCGEGVMALVEAFEGLGRPPPPPPPLKV